MRYHHHLVKRLTIAALLVTSVALGACAGHQVYDPFFHDYHSWNGGEDRFYRQWEGTTGRSHMDFGRRPVGDQHAYFNWRHGR